MRKHLPFLLLALALAAPLSAQPDRAEDESGGGSEGGGPTPAQQAAAQPAASGYTRPDPLLRQIQPLEEAGDLVAAREALETALEGVETPSDAAGAHLGELQRATDALATTYLYENEGLLQQALSSLAKAGDFADPDIRLVLARRSRQLGLHVGRRALAEARAQKDTVHSGRIYARLAADTLLIPAEIRDTAQRALDSIALPARAAALRDSAGATFVGSLRDNVVGAAAGFATVVTFLALLVVFSMGIWFLRKFLPPRAGVSLRVEDLSGEPAGDDAPRRNELLLREIARDLRSLERAAGTSMGEKAEDLDGVANLRPDGELLEQLKDEVEGEPVQLGWIKLSPKQVLEILSLIRYRPWQRELRGNLTATVDGQGAVLFVECYQGKSRNSQFYREEASGTDARRQVIRKFAVRYLYDCAAEKPARTFESFRDYVDALAALERPAGDGHEPLAAARRLLEGAVFHDPDNWQARLKLAEVLRKQGDYRAAGRHYRTVQELIASPHAPASLRSRLDTSPEFRLVVDYNVALTLSLGLDYAEQSHAIDKFDQLLAELETVK